MMTETETLEQTIRYHFQDQTLLSTALVHPSYSGEMHWERDRSNQRLEFLGDAVLELAVSDYLYKCYPRIDEGELTRKRASLVFEAALSVCAKDISLGSYLRLGKGEDISNGREKPSILSDAFEALIGAIYLDGGFPAAKAFIDRFVINDIPDGELLQDGKSIIQEYAQQKGEQSLRYETYPLESPDHEKRFRAELYLNDRKLSAGEGHSKKSAEQEAALRAIRVLGITQTQKA